MLLINILFFIVFSVLLVKALYETMWGICLIINGLFWHVTAFALDTLGLVVRLFRKPQPQPKPATYSVMRGFDAYYGSK